jgi:hypothetical protein
MMGGFSVFLSLLKGGVMGYVAKDAVTLCQAVKGESDSVFWVLCFLSLMGYVMQARSLNQSQQKGGL